MTTSPETGTEAPGKQSGVDSEIILFGAPSTPILSAVPKPSFHTSSTKDSFNQIESCPVCCDRKHRMLNYPLIPDSQKQKISRIKNLNLRNEPAEADRARGGPSQLYRHCRAIITYIEAVIRVPHRDKRRQDDIDVTINRKTSKQGFIGGSVTKWLSPDTHRPHVVSSFAQYIFRRSLSRGVCFSIDVTNRSALLKTYV